MNVSTFTGPRSSTVQCSEICFNYVPCDLSIGSTETKYIKLNTKTQNIFCCVNENLTTFYTLWQGDKKTEGEKKVFFFKVYTKVECY